MYEFRLDEIRQRAISLLEGRVRGVHIRASREFSHMDDAVFYAERYSKAFNLCVISDVGWSDSVSYYTEKPDGLRRKSIMMVDVANGIDGNEAAIVELYIKWFAAKKL